jgi:hypothetical protein
MSASVLPRARRVEDSSKERIRNWGKELDLGILPPREIRENLRTVSASYLQINQFPLGSQAARKLDRSDSICSIPFGRPGGHRQNAPGFFQELLRPLEQRKILL